MIPTKTFLVFTILIIIPLICVAWKRPERCLIRGDNDNSRRKRESDKTIKAGVVDDINHVAAQQNKELNMTYKYYKFFGIPINVELEIDMNGHGTYYFRTPYDCYFHTYKPIRLSSVVCEGGLECKLSEEIETVDTYTASEGRNWGVTVSTKTGIPDLIEVGGDAATGKEFSCSFNKGKTTSHTVECTASNKDQDVNLQLYRVHTDMECKFGKVKLSPDVRDGSYTAIPFLDNDTKYNVFSLDETDNIVNKSGICVKNYPKPQGTQNNVCVLDVEQVDSILLKKLKTTFPLYNTYTDMIEVLQGYHYVKKQMETFVNIMYMKRDSDIEDYRKIIPFTNEGGNSEYQYACITTKAEFSEKH